MVSIAYLIIVISTCPSATSAQKIVEGFSFPVGSRASGYVTKTDKDDDEWHTAQDFKETNSEIRSGESLLHAGEDWNGDGGTNTDVGERVYAVAHGIVTDKRTIGSVGEVVVLKHNFADGSNLYSVYLHIESNLKKDDEVDRDDPIGVIADIDPAHLHFELRTKAVVVGDLYENDFDDSGYYRAPEDLEADGLIDPSDYIIQASFLARTILVIDRSPSMLDELSESTKIELAREGADLFTGISKDGESLGVVSFSGSATTNYPLTKMTESTRDEAEAAISRIRTSSATNITAGLQRALTLITNTSRGACNSGVILLTDGEYNRGGDPLIYAVPGLIENNVVVNTIAIGEGNTEVLRAIAEQTKGISLTANSSADLQTAFTKLSAVTSCFEGIVASVNTTLPPLRSAQQLISIEEEAQQATFLITWPEVAEVDLTLLSPTQRVIAQTGGSDVEFGLTSHARFYKVRSPEAGQWTMQFSSINTTDTVQVAVQASVVNSKVVFPITPSKNSVTFPEELVIRASLLAPSAVVGAAIRGTVTRPDSSTVFFTLYDDGRLDHDDEVVADGSYSNIFDLFNRDGAYTFNISASSNRGFFYTEDGVSNVRAPAVSRMATFSININGVPEDYAPPTPSFPFVLEQNYPNPFMSSTVIRYQIIEETRATIGVYDLLGREIVILVNEEKLPGVHEVMWDGRNSAGQPVAGGVYLYQLTAGGFTTAKTIVRLH